MTLPALGTGDSITRAASISRAREAASAVPLAAGLIVVAGFLLRALGVRGDLWLDEIWTIELVRPLSGWWQVFTDIPHDNNHWLNSAWVMLAGPDAPTPVLRAASVVFGTAAIWAAGFAVRGTPARLSAMALVALSPGLVNYGSEARGYSGLVLATLLAIGLVRRELERPSTSGPVMLGVVALFGLFSHAFMVETLAVLMLWACAARCAEAGSAAGLRLAARLLWPSALACAVWAGCLAWAVMRHGYGFGGMFIANPADFVSGWAEALRVVFGLPAAWPVAACLGAGAAVVAFVGVFCRDRFGLVCAAAFLGIPALLFALAIPNTVFGRYFLVACLFLLLALAQAFGHAMRHRGPVRILAGAGLASMLALQVAGTTDFLALGRGQYDEAVSIMRRDGGEASYGSDRAARAQRIVSYYAARQELPTRLVSDEAWCADPPRWMIRDTRGLPATLTICPDQPHAYRLAGRWESWRHSGAPWSLYRLEDRSGARAGIPLTDTSSLAHEPGLRPSL
jgi:hypothetical protein